ncbi:MAG: transglutaminase-like domain-containing protein [Pirellulales bacterium]
MRNQKRFARCKLLPFAVVVGLVAAGCSRQTDATSPPPVRTAIRAQTERETSTAAKASASPAKISAQGHPKETWDAIYLGGVKVGYCRTQTSDFVEDETKGVRVDSTNSVTVNRAGQRSKLSIVSTSIETPTGELVRFQTRLDSGTTPTDFTGQVEGNELVVETVTAGKATTARSAWPAAAGGVLAMEQSLLRQPMRPGERRKLTGLMAVLNQPVAMELVADKYESTRLLQHSEDLLRIECRALLPDGQPIVERLWANRDGVILRRQIDALAQETYRTTQEIALAALGQAKFDLMLDTTVPADRPLENPHATRRIRYRLHLKTNDPAQIFANGQRQEVIPLDTRTAEVIVSAVRPQAPGTSGQAVAPATSTAAGGPPSSIPPKTSPPTDDDRAPNNLIQSDNPKIVTMAQSIAPDEADGWQVARRLAEAVKRHIRRPNYSQAFASAADVVEHAEGDCTEHAVLLAALCRARDIPARVAIGLVYVSAAQGFGYHMWNEVWIDGGWVGLDATLDRPAIGAAHLKLAHSSLQGTTAFSTFLSLAQVIGQLKIEILEVE